MKKMIVFLAIIALVFCPIFGQGKFEKFAEYKINIPANFSLAQFKTEHEKDFCKFSPYITDKNFKNSIPLVTGEKKLFIYYTADATAEGCMSFIKKKKGKFGNAIVAAIAWEQVKDLLPKEATIFSLDNIKNIFLYQDCYNAPSLFFDGNKWYFSIECVEYQSNYRNMTQKIIRNSYIIFYK